MENILKLTIKYEKLGEHAFTQNSSSKCFCDPTMIKTKGAPKKRDSCKKRSRHCSNCNSTKHNARMCPQCDGTNDKSMNDEQLSHEAESFGSSTTIDSISFFLDDNNYNFNLNGYLFQLCRK